jgi:hypothetical protein
MKMRKKWKWEKPIYIVPCRKATKSHASIKKTLELLYNENCLKVFKSASLKKSFKSALWKMMVLKEDQRGSSNVLVQKFQRSLSLLPFKNKCQ